MKLTKEQLILLNDVFNYAINFVDSHEKDKLILFDDYTNKFVLDDWYRIRNDILALADEIKRQIDVVEKY